LIPVIRRIIISNFPLIKLQVVEIASNKQKAGKYQIFVEPVIFVHNEG